MYAVIETGGKQYRVEVGTELEVDLLEVEPGQEITLDRVLLVQAALQLGRVAARLRLRPALARALRPLDHPVGLRAPRRVPETASRSSYTAACRRATAADTDPASHRWRAHR